MIGAGCYIIGGCIPIIAIGGGYCIIGAGCYIMGYCAT